MPDAETIAAAIAAGPAIVSFGFAVRSERSAEESVAAEERSAKAAEDIVAIERQRLAQELSDRDEQGAPRLHFGEARHHWTVAADYTRLVGHVFNAGPSDAILEEVTLLGPSHPVEAHRFGIGDGFLPAGPDGQQIVFDWPWPDDTLYHQIELSFRLKCTTSEYRAVCRAILRRDGLDTNQQPLYRAGQPTVSRIG